ncbi:hypothetical protein GUJ93_ZPchr0002g26682 [Zizania palustris]|uniref:Uncharacterized protein n=1 Tax=Zizania palustris TaxID=103762 RepID=A0A8J5VI68_ZIZPA|nr:hypothetical protein GUJ93_ZPchr0002g26682 [Zizania palustris]
MVADGVEKGDGLGFIKGPVVLGNGQVFIEAEIVTGDANEVSLLAKSPAAIINVNSQGEEGERVDGEVHHGGLRALGRRSGVTGQNDKREPVCAAIPPEIEVNVELIRDDPFDITNQETHRFGSH